MTEPVRSPDDRTPRWSAHIHESLDAHEAQAAELRRELDDLRRTLEPRIRVPRVAAHRRPKPRGAYGCSGRWWCWSCSRSPPASPCSSRIGPPLPRPRLRRLPRAPPRPTTVAPSAAPPSRSTGPTPSSTVAGADLPPWPGRSVAQPPGLPATGPGADRPGSEITVALDPDRRHVEVYERASSPRAQGRSRCVRPTRPTCPRPHARSSPACPACRTCTPTSTAGPPPFSSDPQGWTVATPAGVPAGHVVLRYRVDGALSRHEPSPAGRYTLVLRPLTPSAGRGAGDAVVVRIDDDQVTELYCPGASDQLCGATAARCTPPRCRTVPRPS